MNNHYSYNILIIYSPSEYIIQSLASIFNSISFISLIIMTMLAVFLRFNSFGNLI